MQIFGKEPYCKLDIKCPMTMIGSEKYGGWNTVLSGLDKDSIVLSFGVGEDVSFDMDLIERYGLAVYAFDPTPKSLRWVEKSHLPKNFIMHGYGLADFDGSVQFSPPENPDHVSHTILNRSETKDDAITVPVKKITTIMSELQHSEIDVLKMDIEGAEYAVISDLEASGIRPKQILVEFHHRFPGVGASKTKDAVDTLKRMGYKLFSVSSSNEEYSFLLE
jgi:FkbM family methyltransferase